MTLTPIPEHADYRLNGTESMALNATCGSAVPDVTDYSANLNHTCDAMATATQMLTTGTYPDTGGIAHSIYPLGYPAVWPEQHHHHHYPWYPTTTTEVHTHVTAPAAEKPHEVVQRALKEIAQATRALKESAQAMGVPVEAAALEEAIVERLRAAL